MCYQKIKTSPVYIEKNNFIQYVKNFISISSLLKHYNCNDIT